MATHKSYQTGYHRTADGKWEIINDHEIHGVTPEMIDWWWDHIDTTERYKLWHPTDHVSFMWLISPATNGHVGAVQRIQERFNGFPETPNTIEIRWEDASGVDAEYDHVLLGMGLGELPGRVMHEYEAAPFGARMRSRFNFPAQMPEPAVEALCEHNKQEMQYFSSFLPDLYRSETM